MPTLRLVTSRRPLLSTLLAAGNHESATDFYEYRMRLGAGMPAAKSPSAGGNGTFSSFVSRGARMLRLCPTASHNVPPLAAAASQDVGLVHIVLVSSEVYFSVQKHSAGLMEEQKAWLEADLKAVDRSVTPFVVLGLHQPF
jgi:hypothetical protein